VHLVHDDHLPVGRLAGGGGREREEGGKNRVGTGRRRLERPCWTEIW
jgi:hypothetical protein